MTPRQLAILNSLVTFAAENIPGGLAVDEREIAQIVGRWALEGRITDGLSTRPSHLEMVSTVREIRQDEKQRMCVPTQIDKDHR